MVIGIMPPPLLHPFQMTAATIKTPELSLFFSVCDIEENVNRTKLYNTKIRHFLTSSQLFHKGCGYITVITHTCMFDSFYSVTASTFTAIFYLPLCGIFIAVDNPIYDLVLICINFSIFSVLFGIVKIFSRNYYRGMGRNLSTFQ